MQPDLFSCLLDPVAGESAKADALEQVEENASEAWKTRALLAVHRVALTTEFFTSNAIWSELQEMTHEPRALGPIMREAVKRGYIVASGRYEKSERPSQHRQPICLWRSLIYREGA